MAALTYRRRTSSGERAAGIAFVALLHVAGFWGLLQLESVRRTIAEAAPIMVDFILPPKAEPPPPPPKIERKPVAPKPETKPAAPPPPVVTTNAIESPTPPVAAEPAKPLPPIAVPLPQAPAPAPVAPPQFNAAYLRNPPPAYPTLSRRYREQGKVVLRVYVSAAGAAEKVELETSSGFARLDEAAQQAVRAWRFVPAMQGERAVAAWVNVPLRFSLDGAGS